MKKTPKMILSAGTALMLCACGSYTVPGNPTAPVAEVSDTTVSNTDTTAPANDTATTAPDGDTATTVSGTTTAPPAADTTVPPATTVRQPEATTKPATTTAPQTAPPSVPFEKTVEINGCRLTFPDSWAGKVRVEGDMVEFMPSNNNGIGHEFFRVKLLSYSEAVKSSDGLFTHYLLGTKDGSYICAVLPPDYVELHDDPQVFSEFEAVQAKFKSVMENAVCLETPSFKPVCIYEYRYPEGQSMSLLGGSWDKSMSADEMVGQVWPFVTFRTRDNAFAYHESMAVPAFGAYIPNLGAGNYQWNTTNWGPAGVILLNGSIYSVTVYLSAPKTLNIEKLSGREDLFAGLTFQYDSDYELIYQDDFTDYEMELP